ncbi:MAG: hypothetical protein CW335_02850 [Clostridiales bacterium]|nr:hypothetical protein [Clostridiales bacterium]
MLCAPPFGLLAADRVGGKDCLHSQACLFYLENHDLSTAFLIFLHFLSANALLLFAAYNGIIYTVEKNRE